LPAAERPSVGQREIRVLTGIDDPDVVAWVGQIFDHPGEGPEWYRDPNIDLPEPEPASRVRLLTILFRDPARYLAQYSDSQVARGLWYLIDNACSSYALALLDREIEFQARLHCITAIPSLFAEVFARRCAPRLSHGETQSETPLNTTCYMWWDIFPSWGAPRRDVDGSILSAMAALLSLESPACQESGLHGLGHWQSAYPERVRGVIDRFLERGGHSDALRRYANSAREGCVQ
jgi:hypothetical protein